MLPSGGSPTPRPPTIPLGCWHAAARMQPAPALPAFAQWRSDNLMRTSCNSCAPAPGTARPTSHSGL